MAVMGGNPVRWWVELRWPCFVLACGSARPGRMLAAASGDAGWGCGCEHTGCGRGVVLDRMVAVVNGEVILESDVDEEQF